MISFDEILMEKHVSDRTQVLFFSDFAHAIEVVSLSSPKPTKSKCVVRLLSTIYIRLEHMSPITMDE